MLTNSSHLFLLGILLMPLTACRPAAHKVAPAETRIHPAASLMTTTLPWLALKDHFVATVGNNAGRGDAMGSLLVLADAMFAPHSRFPMHAHREMEILSIVLDGELTHRGTLGDGTRLPARSAQLISARDGMSHAEGNEGAASTRMLQLWFTPDTLGGAPVYFQRSFRERAGRQLIAGDATMPMRNSARVWWVDVQSGEDLSFETTSGRQGYLLAIDTALQMGGATLPQGTGIEVLRGQAQCKALSRGSLLWIEL